MEMNLENKRQLTTNIVDNIEQSTIAALQTLKHFHQALVQSRLSENFLSYRVMCDSFLEQRRRMLNNDCSQAMKVYEELAATAELINDILSPYLDLLDKLTSLGEINHEADLEAVERTNDEETCDDNLISAREALSNIEGQIENLQVRYSLPEEQTSDSEKSQVLDILKKYKRRTSFTKLRTESGLKRQQLQQVLEQLKSQGAVYCKKIGGREMYEII